MKVNFKILDGLRGLAATYVVVNHSRGFIQRGGAELAKEIPVENWSLFNKLYYTGLQITTLGKEFVVFFFVLSGFSIAHSLTKKPAVLPFYKRRIIRLYPPYFLALVYAALVFWLVSLLAPVILASHEVSVFDNSKYVFLNLVYIPKGSLIDQFWSLTHEVIFYIVLPLCFVRNLRIYLFLSAVFYIAGWVYNWKGLAGNTIPTQFLFDYHFYFAAGIMIYKNYEKALRIFSLKKSHFWLLSLFVFAVSVVVKFKMGDDNRITPLLFCYLSVLMLINFLKYQISNTVFRFLGNLSYTIYITHIASIYLFILLMNESGIMKGRTTDNPVIWPFAVVFSLLLSVPMYLLAEKPTKKILDKLR